MMRWKERVGESYLQGKKVKSAPSFPVAPRDSHPAKPAQRDLELSTALAPIGMEEHHRVLGRFSAPNFVGGGELGFGREPDNFGSRNGFGRGGRVREGGCGGYDGDLLVEIL